MGVKELWTILTPFCERKPLYELQGKKVAIDLSGWVCQAQCIAEYQVQPRMYLRNLYFRTCYMLLQEIIPVFVLEGEAPTLKHNTIQARNAIQFKGAKPRAEGAKTGGSKGRSRFNHTLKLCEEMLKLMGLTCVTGVGEAEAMCAHLNEQGMVDGCISQDSDCFAYGANVVYRNFSISQQGAHAASGGSVDVYDLSKATQAIDFGRNKVIVLALLCGSDYSDGVNGIGKDSVTKLFATISENDILERIKSWRHKNSLFADFENKLSDKNICTSCGHFGKISSHTKIGCKDCGTNKGCDFSKYKEKRLEIKNELNIRKKALEDTDFPNKEIMDEFLVKKDNISKIDLRWKRPDVIKYVKFCRKYLDWDELYSFEKILPILTRWQIYQKETLKNILAPQCIKKKRTPKGVPSYEIIWTSTDIFKNLIPNDQLKDVDQIKLYSTIEPQYLVDKIYPELVLQYQQSKIKPKKPSKRKNAKITSGDSPLKKLIKKVAKRKNKKLDELETSFNNLEINQINDKPMQSQIKIDSYLKKAIINETNNKLVNASINFDPNQSCFGDENDDFDDDLSIILDDIVNQGLPTLVKNKLSQISVKKVENLGDICSSSFFIQNPGEMDLFEASFQKFDSTDDSLSQDDSIEEIDYLETIKIKKNHFNSNEITNENIDETNYVKEKLIQPNKSKEISINDERLLFDNENVKGCEENADKINENVIKYNLLDDTIENDEFLMNNVEKCDDINSDDSFSEVYVPLLERLKKRK